MADYAIGMMGGQVKLEENSCGIKKILDVKITDDGKQMYKVKWEPTWEPAENLVTCQHLIDEFWSFVNIAKVNRENTPSFKNYSSMNDAAKIPRLSEDDKTDVQKLIARTNQTSTGNPTLMSPNMLFNQQNQQTTNNNHLAQDQKPFSGNLYHQNNFGTSPSQKVKPPTSTPRSDVGRERGSNNSTLKYVENFQNPYVKIILVCKICNKEQSLKFAHNWKTHYLSHVSNDEKPHKCDYCPKAFVTLPQKRKHMKTHENAAPQSNVKEEQMYSLQ